MTKKTISALIGSTLLAAAIIIAPKLYAVTYTNGSSSAVSGFISDSVAVVSNTSSTTTTVLKLGDKGPEVTTLQKALIAKGYKTVVANGTYDTATFDGVKKYQTSQRITADGIFGPTTRSFLYGTGISAAPIEALLKTNTSGVTVSPVKTNSTAVPASTTNGNTVGVTVNDTIGTKTTSTTATEAPAGAVKQNTTTTTSATTGCTSTTTPWIKIISPNGDEIYNAGQQITVTWESCNIAKTEKIQLHLQDVNGIEVSQYLTSSEGTVNDGVEKVSLPLLLENIGFTYGKSYRLYIGTMALNDPSWGTSSFADMSDGLFSILGPKTTTTTTTVSSCTNWKVTSGSPQGGTMWEKVRDFSGYPEIDQYRIQWFNGNWSPWYTPTVDDKDTKVNNDGSWRYMISYKQDHNWETRDCIDGTGTDSPIDIMTSPRTGPSKEVVQGQKDVEFGRFLITNKNKTAPARPSEIFLTQVGSLTPYSLVDGDSNVKNIALYDTKGKRLTDFMRLGNDGSVNLANYNEAFSIDKNAYLEVVLRGDISSTATVGKTIAFKAYKGTAHYPSLGTQETIVAVKPDTVNSLTIVSGTSTTTCSAKTTGAFTLTNQGTPEGAMFSTGHSPMNDFHFATLSLKTTKTSGPICLNSIQLGALTDPNLKISKVSIYNTGGKLLATVPMSDWYKIENNTSWAAWVPLKLDIKKGNLTEKFIIKADVMDSSSVTAGLFNLGISGMTFGGPGARGSSLSFGNVFAVN